MTTEKYFFQWARVAKLHNGTPQFGTHPEQLSHYWFEVIGNRTNLTDGKLWQLINNGKRPTLNLEIEYPHNQVEDAAMNWFDDLSPKERLNQIRMTHAIYK